VSAFTDLIILLITGLYLTCYLLITGIIMFRTIRYFTKPNRPRLHLLEPDD